MDLGLGAYASSASDDDDADEAPAPGRAGSPRERPAKLARPNPARPNPPPTAPGLGLAPALPAPSAPPPPAPAPTAPAPPAYAPAASPVASGRAAGRYLSKRERAAVNPNTVGPGPGAAAEWGAGGPAAVRAALLEQPLAVSEARAARALSQRGYGLAGSRLPGGVRWLLAGHAAGVNSVEWAPRGSRLLASAGNDRTVRLWDPLGPDAARACSGAGPAAECRPVATFAGHGEAVRQARWSGDGLRLLSCSYDATARLTDVERGACLDSFVHREAVAAVAWHPSHRAVFVAGGAAHGLVAWDSRAHVLVAEYRLPVAGQVHCIEWLGAAGREFVSTADVTRRNALDRGVCVWDFARGALLSNQVYTEAYTCPAARLHPAGRQFALQSNGNYIAACSASAPYKMSRGVRLEGHVVAGHRVGLDFTPAGDVLASGSADGRVVFYGWEQQRLLASVRVTGPGPAPGGVAAVTTDVAFHPLLPDVLAASSWAGHIAVLN